ncbi:hypothetical protein F4779DRAFT_593218 [Xylariaceae sp. FL0662B]|nr:hypothetical protein F4779DRAFT_593218 [Xylariaceae sp. FL0662B]
MQKATFLILINAVFGVVAIPSFANKFIGRKVNRDIPVAARQQGRCVEGCTPTLCYLKIVGDQCNGCPGCPPN